MLCFWKLPSMSMKREVICRELISLGTLNISIWIMQFNCQHFIWGMGRCQKLFLKWKDRTRRVGRLFHPPFSFQWVHPEPHSLKGTAAGFLSIKLSTYISALATCHRISVTVRETWESESRCHVNRLLLPMQRIHAWILLGSLFLCWPKFWQWRQLAMKMPYNPLIDA